VSREPNQPAEAGDEAIFTGCFYLGLELHVVLRGCFLGSSQPLGQLCMASVSCGFARSASGGIHGARACPRQEQFFHGFRQPLAAASCNGVFFRA